MATINQKPSLLPPAPPYQVLSANEWKTLAAIVDTVIPSIIPEENAHSPAVLAINNTSYTNVTQLVCNDNGSNSTLAVDYLSESATSCPDFQGSINRLLANYMDSEQKKSILLILKALNTRAGSLLLTGTTTNFVNLDYAQRQHVLSAWANAYIPVYRAFYRSFTSLAKVYWIRTSPTLGRILSYPKTPIDHNFGPGFPFSFLQFPPASAEDPPETIETDVLIVGSGCTGAVAASILSAAGLSVIVTDKSYYWPPEHLPMSESSAASNLFSNGGVTLTEDGNLSIVSGSCWGGGGTVNWSASLQLQGYVRQAWANSSGIPYFTSAAFQNDMDAVCERMGVSTAHITHNFANRQLLEGARKLGMNAKAVPQNTGGAAHNCGYCTLGCGSCGKKGPTESWLPDAANHGAKFIEGFECTSVIFSTDTSSSDRIATGATGIWTSRDSSSGISDPSTRHRRKLTIKARHSVILASGALCTPLLLTRSGLTNPHIGKHLHLHPVSFAGAIHDIDILPWDGSILTSVVNDLEKLDRAGHGVKLEATTMIPGLFLPAIDPTNNSSSSTSNVAAGGMRSPALQWKLFAAKMRRMTGYISLARDESEGSVFADAKDAGRVRVRYSVNKGDRRRIALGLEALARILFVGGAREVFVNVPGVPSFVRQTTTVSKEATLSDGKDGEGAGVNDAAFQSWLGHLRQLAVKGHGPDASFASAHQMGSARMGSSAKTSVVDPHGRVWGTKGLYVVDTSVFPSASGVNPMITGMGVARGIARGIVKEYNRDVGGTEAARVRL